MLSFRALVLRLLKSTFLPPTVCKISVFVSFTKDVKRGKWRENIDYVAISAVALTNVMLLCSFISVVPEDGTVRFRENKDQQPG